MISSIKEQSPVSWDLAPTQEELNAIHTLLREKGIRVWPYPFEIAFAVTSDIDRSQTNLFKAYTGQVVNEHGLDFGDSV